MKNDIGYEEYCFQEQYVSPFEEYFSRLCASVLPQGEKMYSGIIIEDESIQQRAKTPAQFIAYGFNIFNIYNNDSRVNEKEKILNSIKEQALDIYEESSRIIRKIARKYEKE